MGRKLTLGSLFSGSGGFELAGLLLGVEPIWNSEIEPFPIRVTTKRFPKMTHLGDINEIDGSKIPPVDIITGGFCCQDLSVAGRRAGLKGERSGLFYQIPRIIKEMRIATNNEYPKYVVLENVPGMYSSGGGSDFMEVLNEIIKAKDETLSVPMPEKNKWSTAGEIVGDGFSIAWRTLDAQFWGVPQRRRRCYIVCDFTGESAGEILFDETRLRGNPPKSFRSWEGTARDIENCFGNSSKPIYSLDRESMNAGYQFDRIPGINENVAATLQASGPGGVCHTIENRPQDCRVKIREDGICQTLDARMGTGGGNVPLVLDEQLVASPKDANKTFTLTANDGEKIQCVLDPKTLKIRSGCEGGGKGALIQDNLSATLATNNDQTVFVPQAYGICSQGSNSMQSSNPTSGFYEANTSRTIDGNAGRPDCHQGGIAVVCVEGNGTRPSHKGSGVGEDISFTLNTVERHAVCYQDKVGSLCASDYKFPQQQQIEEGKAIVEQVTVENHQHSGYRESELSGTLKSTGGTNGGGSECLLVENQYVVRRLTPLEGARLQGFPDWWCDDLGIEEPTEEDITFWAEVWETHRKTVGNAKKPKSRNQLIKWLKNPHTDSAEYKMWGNGVALPCVLWVLGGIIEVEEKQVQTSTERTRDEYY